MISKSVMASLRLCCLLLVFYVPFSKCQSRKLPPQIPGSFEAVGELVFTTDIAGNDVSEETDFDNLFSAQVMFEENYSVEKKMCSVTLWEIAQKVTYLEDLDLEETYRYGRIGANPDACVKFSTEEWEHLHVPPDIKVLETQGNKLFFPLRQLFNMPKENVEGPTTQKYNGIDAEVWKFTLNRKSDLPGVSFTITVHEFWSVKNWITSSPDGRIPIGFNIVRTVDNGTTTFEEYQFITITDFVNGTVNEIELQGREGLYCEGRSKSRKEFPNIKMLDFFAYSYEFVVPEFQEAKNGRTWVDLTDMVIRADYDPLNQPDPYAHEQYSASRIFTNRHGITYEIGRTQDTECKIMLNKNADYDPQIIYNVKIASQWSPEGLFGLDRHAEYFYIGETTKRGFPCSVWQAKRTDWPPDSPVNSLWEWCIDDNNIESTVYNKNSYPLVALTIYIIKDYGKKQPNFSPRKPMRGPLDDSNFYYPGMKLEYHFYDIHTNANGSRISEIFDLTPCYAYEQIYPLQFSVVPVDDTQKIDLSTAPMDAEFSRAWKKAMYRQMGVDPDSLLLQDFRTVFVDSNRTFVLFNLLDPHPDLPEGTQWKKKTKEELKIYLEDSIQSSMLKIQWTPLHQKKPVELKANYSSLKFQEGFRQPDTPQTEKPTTTTTTTTPAPPPPRTKPTPRPTPTPRTKSPATPPPQPRTKPTKSTEPWRPPTAPPRTRSTPSSTYETESPDEPETESPKPITEKEKKDDHVSGNTVAGVIIGCLLGGIGLGAASTFAKVKLYNKRG